MSLSDLTTRISEKHKSASESRANVFDARNVLARVESYDGNFINVTTVSSGESFRVRLADAEEFAKSYVQDSRLSDEEKLGTAQKRITSRPSVNDMTNPRKLVYMPVDGMIEIEQPLKINNGNDNEFYCSWIKGISNDPKIEAVIEGKVSYIMRTERSRPDQINQNIAPDQDVDRDRQYSIAVLQDGLTQILQTSSISTQPDLIEQNRNIINQMMSGVLLEKDSFSNGLVALKDGGGNPVEANGAQAMIALELEDGKVYCTPLRHVIPDPKLEGNFIASPDGIIGYLDSLEASKTKLSIGSLKDMGRTICIAAASVLTGYDKKLPFADADAEAVFNAAVQDINNGKVKAVVTPQVWLRPLKSVKLAMTDLNITSEKNAGRQKAYTNQGYFDGKICLRTETTNGHRMTNANAKIAYFDAQAPRADYKPQGIITLMEHCIQEAYNNQALAMENSLDNSALDDEYEAHQPDDLTANGSISGFDDDAYDDYSSPSGP